MNYLDLGRDVLKLRPGITGPAMLKYRLEDEMIAENIAQKQKEVDIRDPQDIADEKTLRDVNPNLSDIAAIREWAQQLIDCRIQEMAEEDEETISVEEAREMTLKAVREEYARVRSIIFFFEHG